MGAAVWRNFSIGVGGQVLTVREQRFPAAREAAIASLFDRYTVQRKFGGVPASGGGWEFSS
jgi:hypothetical protein